MFISVLLAWQHVRSYYLNVLKWVEGVCRWEDGNRLSFSTAQSWQAGLLSQCCEASYILLECVFMNFMTSLEAIGIVQSIKECIRIPVAGPLSGIACLFLREGIPNTAEPPSTVTGVSWIGQLPPLQLCSGEAQRQAEIAKGGEGAIDIKGKITDHWQATCLCDIYHDTPNSLT